MKSCFTDVSFSLTYKMLMQTLCSGECYALL